MDDKFDWDHSIHLQPTGPSNEKNVSMVWDAYKAIKEADGVCILTEWNVFKKLGYQKIYNNMRKPALFLMEGLLLNVMSYLRLTSIFSQLVFMA